MALRLKILDKIVDVFKLHGAETIDTPVFELKVIFFFSKINLIGCNYNKINYLINFVTFVNIQYYL